MTIRDVSRQLYSLSVGGFFNGEKFTERQLHNYIAAMFRPNVGPLKLGNQLVMEVALPDGWWYMYIIKYADRADGFDYYIPDTREDSDRIRDALFQG